MKKEVKKFLEFNGKVIYFVAADGQYWIALKPICEALGVDFEAQRKNLKEDEILAQLPSEQTVVAADGKLRKMLCLPEFYIYGWIFQIQSQSEDLLKYKWECYRVLYEHFHGAIGGRKDLLKEKAKAQLQIDQIYNGLTPDEAITINKARKKINQINSKLRQLDTQTLQEERDLFST
ncbi:phage antirepressor N-terminal domain-containing protein [uncultured Sunxiuqinia sp.]|uniref:phage antirepressor N-terminal domain-containing protein n=1 Tax=uncultured Sunxiuqinia sp. TaxID=1573825 RepID=UPI00261CCDE2|nr:phage antirepressor N-terminal domain-containing protein [uncultured Sunxiuqinia sp.]